jgi:FAS-associated factor 2
MAGAVEVDLEQLSARQREALQSYTDVTGQEVKDAIALLQRSEWNVQVCAASGVCLCFGH